MSDINKNFGVNITGFFYAEVGFGEAVRNNLKALKKAGIDVNAINFDFNRNLQGRLSDSSVEVVTENTYPVNIIHVNMDTIEQFIEEKTPDFYKNKYNIGYWVWEMEEFPEKYRKYFSYYDEIWTCSEYCQDSISLKSPIPVINIPHPVEIKEEDINAEYDANLPDDTFKFLFIFDYNSSILRKNVFAVIDSFEKAFGRDNFKVCLVLKASPSSYHPNDREAVVERVKSFSNIVYKEDMLRKKDLLSLISQTDCYVSLHRAEGFGLTLAEAMALGKPVIATGYSGNGEFMNINNSFPVKYKIVNLEQEWGPLPKGSYWAEPDVDHAAELMSFVYENQENARKIGEKARKDIEHYFSLETIGDKMKQRLEIVKTELIPLKSDSGMKWKVIELEAENRKLTKRVCYLEKSLYNKIRKKVNDFFSKLRGEK